MEDTEDALQRKDQQDGQGAAGVSGSVSDRDSSVESAEKETPNKSGSSSSGNKTYQSGSFEWGVGAFSSRDEQQSNKATSRLPLILAIVGLVLCFTSVLAFAGVACGIAALVIRYFNKKKAMGASVFAAPKTTLALSICSIVLGILIMIGGAAGGANQTQLQNSPNDSSAQQKVEPAKAKELSFVVEGDKSSSLPASVVVLVSGTQSDGTKVQDRHTAAVGKTYVLAYPAGTYSFSLDSASLAVGDAIYKSVDSRYSFDGNQDHTVHISLSQDTEATQKAQAEREAAERQKAEQAAAAAAAEQEAAAAAEQEAAAVAEQEAAAAAAVAEQEAAAAVSGGSGGADTVYITNTGEKYHSGGCQYLKKSKIPISRSDAIAQGYGACSKCNP